MVTRYFLFIPFLCLIFLLQACSNNDPACSSTTKVSFYITDAPKSKDVKFLHLDVQSVEYSVSGDEKWVNLDIQPKQIELLQFNNGKDSLLSNVNLNEGEKISQIRLVLGDNSTITLSDGTTQSIKIPSGQTSGFKINVQSNVEVTSGYKVVIDFDAQRSIVAKGNGSYSLKPVIRAYIEANSSFVEGYLTPDKQQTKVFTVNSAGDTISTVSDTLNNNYFRLHGLFSGAYKLEVQNLEDGRIATLQEVVNVVGGTNVSLGSLAIPAYPETAPNNEQ